MTWLLVWSFNPSGQYAKLGLWQSIEGGTRYLLNTPLYTPPTHCDITKVWRNFNHSVPRLFHCISNFKGSDWEARYTENRLYGKLNTPMSLLQIWSSFLKKKIKNRQTIKEESLHVPARHIIEAVDLSLTIRFKPRC